MVLKKCAFKAYAANHYHIEHSLHNSATKILQYVRSVTENALSECNDFAPLPHTVLYEWDLRSAVVGKKWSYSGWASHLHPCTNGGSKEGGASWPKLKLELDPYSSPSLSCKSCKKSDLSLPPSLPTPPFRLPLKIAAAPDQILYDISEKSHITLFRKRWILYHG